MSVEALRPSALIWWWNWPARATEGHGDFPPCAAKWLMIKAMALDWGGCFFLGSAPLRFGPLPENRSGWTIRLNSKSHKASQVCRFIWLRCGRPDQPSCVYGGLTIRRQHDMTQSSRLVKAALAWER